MSLTPKNWKSFQHYKDRAPAWIKLHKGLLDDFSFSRLPVASKALAPMLWLLASEYEGGEITCSLEEIAFRLRMSDDEFTDALSPLIQSGFFSASASLAECKRSAIPEKEGEREEREIGGGVEEAREPEREPSRKSLISPDAFDLANQVLRAMGKDLSDPICVGAPLTVQGWFNAGWNAQCILVGVQRGMASRKGDPPSTLKYFEKAIARAHAELMPAVPVAEIRQAEIIQVNRHGTNQSQPNSLMAAIDRKLARLEAEDGADPAVPEGSVLRLSHGSIR